MIFRLFYVVMCERQDEILEKPKTLAKPKRTVDNYFQS